MTFEPIRIIPREENRKQITSCSKCGLTLEAADLEDHVRQKHVRYYPFVCPLCEHAFVTDKNLSFHHNMTHPDLPKKRVWDDLDQKKELEIRRICAESVGRKRSLGQDSQILHPLMKQSRPESDDQDLKLRRSEASISSESETEKDSTLQSNSQVSVSEASSSMLDENQAENVENISPKDKCDKPSSSLVDSKMGQNPETRKEPAKNLHLAENRTLTPLTVRKKIVKDAGLTCNLCGVEFRSVLSMAEHALKIHAKTEPFFRCQLCYHTSWQSTSFKKHCQSLHKSEPQGHWDWREELAPMRKEWLEICFGDPESAQVKQKIQSSLKSELESDTDQGARLRPPKTEASLEISEPFLSTSSSPFAPPKKIPTISQGTPTSKGFQCALCPAQVVSSGSKIEHALRAHAQSEPLFRCQTCPYSCWQQTSFKNHTTKYHGAEAEGNWDRRRELAALAKQWVKKCFGGEHSGNDSVPLESVFEGVQGAIFTESGFGNDSMSQKRPNTGMKCRLCELDFRSYSSKNEHALKVHGESPAFFHCQLCSYSCWQLTSFKNHSQASHGCHPIGDWDKRPELNSLRKKWFRKCFGTDE